MIWYKINDNWWIDVTQVREFGIPKDGSNIVIISFKNGDSEQYSVPDANKELKRFEEFIHIHFFPDIPSFNKGELPYALV